jgi:hypothetical protein
MKTTLDEKIRRNPEWSSAVERATGQLQALVVDSRFAAEAEAEWSVVRNGGPSPGFLLRISDPVAEAKGVFSLEEFKDTSQMRRHLNWLWGDFLQDLSHKQLDKLHQTVQQLEGD